MYSFYLISKNSKGILKFDNLLFKIILQLSKNFNNFIKEYDPDILCLQETKAHPDQVLLNIEELPYRYWNSAEKKGYSGTSVFLKKEPINNNNNIGIKKHDNEGRVITLELEGYYLVNVYTPNSKRDLSRLDYRQNEWDVDFLKYLKKLEKKTL